MNYLSTSGRSPAAGFDEAVVRAIAPDGGLYIPERIPGTGQKFLRSVDEETLISVGSNILTPFVEEISNNDLQGILTRAWTFPVPLLHLENNIYLLELFHGPTLAFKDIGTRCMAELLSHILTRKNERITILVATSGDTGGAVAGGFHNVPLIDVYILYPSEKISRLQEQQITTPGSNIHAIEVDGTFDDCQDLLRQSLNDTDVQKDRIVTTANSINIGRLLPQIAYYAWGIMLLRRHLRGKFHEPIVIVPTGNAGNLTAGVYAKRMGIPIKQLVAATNVNDILPIYLSTGVFSPRQSTQTYSSAMDVGNPGNFARLQALYYNNVRQMRNDIEGLSFSDEETLDAIRSTYTRTGYTLDPHTAVGVAAARSVTAQRSDGAPCLVLSTAHPAKFPEVIREAIGKEIPLPPSLAAALRLPKKSERISSRYSEWKSILLSR